MKTAGSGRLDVVLFELGTRSYGIERAAVREVLRFGAITPVPAAPESIVGAMNAAGHVLPVIDLGALLGQGATSPRGGETGLWVADGEQQAVLSLGRIQTLERLRAAQPVPGARSPVDATGLTQVMVSEQGTLHLVDVGRVFEEVARQVARMVAEIRPAQDQATVARE